MTQTSSTPPYTLGTDDKVAQVMAYTQNNLYWGDVVVKEMIRVSTWLRTNSAPERITLYNAKVMNVLNSTATRPVVFTELNLAVSQILAFHLVPPAKDPLDYDPTEPNRKMEPVSLLVSSFRIDGVLRLSSRSSLAKFLEVTRENYSGVYDAKITSTVLSALGTISVPFLLVRQETTVFTHA
jgi:hypothetical protein